MADDYDYDDDFIDMDDAWFYVEDEFDLADELAENQIPSPGYSGNNHEIDLEGFEFDLYGYGEDLEYGDDPYWDYGTYGKDEQAGEKRKRGLMKADTTPSKKKRSGKESADRELEPTLFRSRDERNKLSLRDPPLQRKKAPFSFMGDWKERFADADGIVLNQKMPASMQAAAEAKPDETPEKQGRFNEDDFYNEDGEDWEDEYGEEDGKVGLAVDPEMLKAILKEKLAAAGLDGMNETSFMDTIRKMMSGGGEGEDAAGMLANSLLGKVASNTGDEALAGWLSGQGVNLEDDDDASSVATTEQEPLRYAAASKERKGNSPPDSAVELPKTTQMPLNEGSPTGSTKKRKLDAVTEGAPRKKTKKVAFDASLSSSSQSAHVDPSVDNADTMTSADRLVSGLTITARSIAANAAAVQANNAHINGNTPADGDIAASDTASNGTGRKRKAMSAEAVGEKPAEKKSRSRELQNLQPLPHISLPGGPARRTRNAKAKAGQ